MAIQALITAEVNPPEVEARMVALGIGLENLVGLLQIWEGNENIYIYIYRIYTIPPKNC